MREREGEERERWRERECASFFKGIRLFEQSAKKKRSEREKADLQDECLELKYRDGG